MKNPVILCPATFVAVLAFALSACEKSDGTVEGTPTSTAVVGPGPAGGAPDSRTQPVAVGEQSMDCPGGVALYRPVFTDQVKHGSPHNRLVLLGADESNVVFHTEIIGAAGKRITHRWFQDDAELKAVSFDIEDDRSQSWSSYEREPRAPGVLRVEVLDGSCVIGRKSLQIAASSRIDPATRTGWMRPKQALETALARQAAASMEDSRSRRPIDGRDQSGDTWLTAAIRRGDEAEALKLIQTHDMNEIPDANRLSREEYDQYLHRANPLLPDSDGISPIDLAHRMGQVDIVEALIESAISPRKQSRRANRGRDVGMWGDSVVHTVSVGTGADHRFADGDTGLHRAVRQGNERAVLTLLQLGRRETSQPEKVAGLLYAYDARGRQPLDIARSEGFHGVERLLQMATERYEPRWALNRATFAASMNGDEPAECREVGFSDESELTFFAELVDVPGKRIRHEWRFEGEVVHTATFEIGSPRWKTHSKRRFLPSEVGMWEVRILDEEGDVMGTRRLRYIELTPEIQKRRQNYIGSKGCDLGGGAMYAIVDGWAPISRIEYLLDSGATLKPRGGRHQDLFYKAIESGNIGLTRWFLDRGAEIDATVKNATMPLAIAAKAGDVRMVLFLIAKGADLNQQRFRNKMTALQVALVDLDVEVARALLEKGADPNVPDSDGSTALHRATRRCSAELSILLLERGADPLAKNRAGATPKQAAAKCPENETWQLEMAGLEPLFSRDVSAPEEFPRQASSGGP